MRYNLPARIKAVNRANKYADEQLYPALANVFKDLVGKPILKADGSLLKKVEALLPEFPS